MAVATEIRLNKAERLLHVEFDDGARFSLPAEYLRVESPSAEVCRATARTKSRSFPASAM